LKENSYTYYYTYYDLNCSGLIELDTLIGDNNNKLLRCQNRTAGCKLAYSDRKYSDKWIKKFNDNKLRDQRVLEKLLQSGWKVAIIWECATRDAVVFENITNSLYQWIEFSESQYFVSA